MTILREAPVHPSQPVRPHEIPETPPDEVLAEVALVAERVDELRALGRSFHFARDAHSGRVTAEMHCHDSGATCEITLAALLDVVGGDALPV